MASRFKSAKEFWPHYLATHSKPATRAMHYAGTALGVATAVTLVATSPVWLPVLLWPVATLAAVVVPLFASHAIFEKNQPATFESKAAIAWAVKSELKMVSLWCRGKLRKEFEKHGIDYTGKSAPVQNRPKAEAPKGP